ncbi:hypothetical protein P167DRAFT_574411 [Morchella conica CCBAS932]|uniref:Uncharacterized protein n=1 Tax=Morchella conica CCBAS932 TaxID=1392247 RepID=A0A3N4KP33_9PEZI|nr:hypothetical protein P167DRAFT_574411 [Morchella conica CCBAS932]
MLSASNNLSSPRALGCPFTSRSLTRPTNNGTRTWASIVAGSPQPKALNAPRAPSLQAVPEHGHSNIPTLTLGEPLVPLDGAMTSLGHADWCNVMDNGVADPPSVFNCWNMGASGLDVYGYPINGYPWKATPERARTPQPGGDPTPARIVYTARTVSYDSITRLPSPVRTTSTSNDISKLEDIDAMTVKRTLMPENNSEHVSKPNPRGLRVKETSQQRSERRRRNGGRKRNANWLARHGRFMASRMLEEK